MTNTAANMIGSVTEGRHVSVSGLGPDGCTCAAMLWVFLPCWIGLSDRLGDTKEAFYDRRRHRVLQQTQRRGVNENELKDAIDDDWILERFDVESKLKNGQGNEEGDGRGWKMSMRPPTKQSHSRRHQSGCYCGMPSRDASGNVCANTFLRPPARRRSSTLDRTLAMIKPDAVQHRDEIRALIKEHGFTIARVRIHLVLISQTFTLISFVPICILFDM